MCPLRRALTMARRRVQRTAAAAGGWASWGGHGIGIHSPKVTLVLSLRVDLRWWMAVVDRGVVVCDEWGLVVASANIGEGGFCRNAPSNINQHPLGVCRDPVIAHFYFVSMSSTTTTVITSHSGSWTQFHMSIPLQYYKHLAASIVRPRIHPPLVDEKAGHASRSRVQLSKNRGFTCTPEGNKKGT